MPASYVDAPCTPTSCGRYDRRNLDEQLLESLQDLEMDTRALLYKSSAISCAFEHVISDVILDPTLRFGFTLMIKVYD